MAKAERDVLDRLNRGRERMKKGAQKVNECFNFYRNKQYVFVNKDGYLVSQGTVTGEQGKPAWRARTTRNMIFDHVEHEVSATTQTVPGYQVSPSTIDPEDIGGARLAEKVARFGYDKWRIRDATVRTAKNAIVAREGFAWPYFDNTVGKVLDEEEGVCEGEIAIRVLGPNEVFWEPGVRFEESRWHAIEQARPPEDVKSMPGFTGVKLQANATTTEVLGEKSKQASAKLTMVTEYLERPSPKNPKGRRLVMDSSGVLLIPEESYPCADGKGEIVDEPVLHKLSYAVDPDNDRDLGLVEFMLDAQRTINDCTNKQIEWKNLALVPQLVLRNLVLEGKRTDEPGAVLKLWGNGEAKFQDVPPIPRELSEMKNEAREDLGRIAAQNDIPNQVDSGKGLQLLIERDSSRRAAFVAQLADWHSRLMRHCLYLVQRHYTEPRLLKIRGRFGPELLSDFRGSDLRGQADITVLPGSLIRLTKEDVERRLTQLAQLFPGWMTPEKYLAALNGGTAEALIESYELDVSWANHCIQLIRGMETMTTEPDQVPEARPFDNHDVQIQVIQDWAKTTDYASLGPGPQQAALELIQQHQNMKAQDLARQQAEQMAVAQGLGMANATKPSNGQMPSVPGGLSPAQGTQPSPAGQAPR